MTTSVREAEWFGGVVRGRREQHGLDTYVDILERGENVPTLSVILQLAAALDIHPMELLREYPRKW